MKGIQRNSRITSTMQDNSQRYKSKSEKGCLLTTLVMCSHFSNQNLHEAHETVLILREFSNVSVRLLLFRPKLLNTFFFPHGICQIGLYLIFIGSFNLDLNVSHLLNSHFYVLHFSYCPNPVFRQILCRVV